jgi:hypothetical protein
MAHEIWKPIKDWQNYEVSNLGNVRSLERIEDFRGGTRIRKGCLLKQRVLRKYKCVSVKNYGTQRTFLVHRLVADAFVPNPDNKSIVNHIDKDRLNNSAENLEWVTQKENIHHAMQYEDWTKGENHGMSKLKEQDIIAIRSYDKSYLKLAEMFNVTYSTIKRVRSKKAWKHV